MLGGRQEIAGVLGSAGGDGDVNVNVRGSVKGCGEDQGNMHRISEKRMKMHWVERVQLTCSEVCVTAAKVINGGINKGLLYSEL